MQTDSVELLSIDNAFDILNATYITNHGRNNLLIIINILFTINLYFNYYQIIAFG